MSDVQTCMSPPQARHLIDRAVQVARASRSVTAVIFLEDVQEAEYEDPPMTHGAVFKGDTNGARIVKQSLKVKLKELTTR